MGRWEWNGVGMICVCMHTFFLYMLSGHWCVSVGGVLEGQDE